MVMAQLIGIFLIGVFTGMLVYHLWTYEPVDSSHERGG